MAGRGAAKLGILVATAPQAGDLPIVLSSIARALREGDDVALFLMDDGVGYALEPRVTSFIDEGLEIALCAMDAEARGLDFRRAEAAGVIIGSQYDHGRLLRDSDRFLSFT